MCGFAVSDTACVGTVTGGSGSAGAHLPDTRLLAIHHGHVAGLAVFDELLLCLIELLRHEAHEGVVWGVSYSPIAEGEEGVTKHPSSALFPGPASFSSPYGACADSIHGWAGLD